MSQQLALTLAAAAVGFVAAVYFCIGNVMNAPASIVSQATPRWDFSEPLARSLAMQRAQYVVGAVLLVASFALQVAAILASPTTLSPLPGQFQLWPQYVLAVLVIVGAVSATGAKLLHRATLNKVLALGTPSQSDSTGANTLN